MLPSITFQENKNTKIVGVNNEDDFLLLDNLLYQSRPITNSQSRFAYQYCKMR